MSQPLLQLVKASVSSNSVTRPFIIRTKATTKLQKQTRNPANEREDERMLVLVFGSNFVSLGSLVLAHAHELALLLAFVLASLLKTRLNVCAKELATMSSYNLSGMITLRISSIWGI